MKNTTIILSFLSLLLFSCKTDKTTETNTTNIISIDTTTVLAPQDSVVEIVDSTNIIAEKDLPKSVQKILNDTEVKESKEKIEKVYGTQWDFCTCVIKGDSVNKAFETDLSDEEFDVVMARSDFIDTKCKTMMTTPNTTPEERLKHQSAVAECKKAFKNK